MIDIVRRRTDIGNGIQIINEKGDLLSFLLTLDNDLLISIRNNEQPAVFNINLSDENLYLLIEKLYENIKNDLNDLGEHKLFHDNIVDYHSDESDYNVGSRLIITKNKYDYNLMILNNKLDNTNNTVIISNKSMRYMGNIVFFELYNSLNYYDIITRRLKK